MKLTILLLTAACLQVSAAGKAQTITFSGQNVPLEKVMKEVQRQTGYVFLYEEKLLTSATTVTIQAKQLSLTKFLDMVLENQPVKYRIVSKSIILSGKTLVSAVDERGDEGAPKVDNLLPIRIRVVDPEGNPLAGASVTNKTSNQTGITDAGGGLSLEANKGDRIEVSFVGYEKQLYTVKDASAAITIVLKRVNSALDEVVVNKGYYTERQRLNTGNVSRVTSEEIQRQPVTNVLAALAGRVPGMLVTQGNGLPGSSFKVEVRGRTAIDRTLTDDQPLFIIDGIPVAANNSYLNMLSSGLGDPAGIFAAPGGLSPFAGLNTSDIESIEVLKDGDATAIYGSRGANGVVLITTKRGRKGKTSVSVNGYTGFSEVAKPIKTLNTQQYVALRRQAFLNDNVTPTLQNAFDILVWDSTRYTDFNKLMGRNRAYINDLNVSLSGGSERTAYIIGGAYHRETTVLPGKLGLRRGTMHFNVNHESEDKKFSVLLTGSFSADKNTVPNNDFAQYYSLPPNLKLYEEDGSLAFNEGGVFTQGPLSNPMAYFKQQYTSQTNNLVGNLRISYELLPRLTVRVNGGYNNIATYEQRLSPASSTNPLQNLGNVSNFSETRFVSYLIEPQAEYSHTLGNGTIQLLAGGTIQSINTTSQQLNVRGQPSEDLLESFTGATSITGSRSIAPYRYNAIFGRINYNLHDRYLLNLTARRDGSSRFGSDKQFANFGSAGAAWIFSDESFMQNIYFLSFGKLRGSYGLTGNDKIANYQFLDTWRPSSYNYSSYSSLAPYKLFNPDYRWEKTVKKELALELGFLKDRLQASVVWYHSSSSNQLVQYKLPQITGFSGVVANLPAKVVNKGWEIQITSRNVRGKHFNWTTSFNITLPKNILVDFPAIEYSSYRSTYLVGKSLNLIYNLRYTGVDPQTGLYTFVDVNKDDLLNEEDYMYNGNRDPKFYGGINNSLTWKNFQLDLFFTFRKQTGKGYVASFGYYAPGTQKNVPVEMNDFWSGPGDEAQFQRLTQSLFSPEMTQWSNYNISNGIYTDASFIRLANAALSYTLPTGITSKVHIASARLYVQAQNLFAITGYKVGDPETQDLNVTPPLRTIAGGIQLNF